MRIISLVPSWTETLIESGVTVVGRTRFCLHPRAALSQIPIVGGTKTADWKKIADLKPDLLILDQQENPKDFSEQGVPYWSSNVKSLETFAESLQSLSAHLQNPKLMSLKNRVENLLKISAQATPSGTFPGCEKILRNWSLKPEPQFHYVIWRDPWMEVTRETYIGSVLSRLGIQLPHAKDENLYPQFESLSSQDHHVYLFSSEPYPFRKKLQDLQDQGVAGALVNGEFFSWFGVRSVRFLEKALGLSESQ